MRIHEISIELLVLLTLPHIFPRGFSATSAIPSAPARPWAPRPGGPGRGPISSDVVGLGGGLTDQLNPGVFHLGEGGDGMMADRLEEGKGVILFPVGSKKTTSFCQN